MAVLTGLSDAEFDRAAMDAIEGRAPRPRKPQATASSSNDPFSAAVGEWARKVEGAFDVVFKEAAQEVVSELNTLVPVDTGFLRASLMASTTEMPRLSVDNPGTPVAAPGAGQIELVIAGSEAGDTIFLGYTARYGAYVHAGANGRPGRPWVAMVAQRWQAIVSAKAAEVRSRLGL